MYGCLYVGDYVENWVNHKMDAASAAIAKVVVVHVLQTCLCMYVCMYVLFKPPAHSMHDFVNLGETCCDEAGAQRGPERPREA